jgi:hypothetical protein
MPAPCYQHLPTQPLMQVRVLEPLNDTHPDPDPPTQTPDHGKPHA